jgi:hypothetical protein
MRRRPTFAAAAALAATVLLAPAALAKGEGFVTLEPPTKPAGQPNVQAPAETVPAPTAGGPDPAAAIAIGIAFVAAATAVALAARRGTAVRPA